MKAQKYARDRRKDTSKRRRADEQYWELRVHTGRRKPDGRLDVRTKTFTGNSRDADAALDAFKREVEEGLKLDRRLTVAAYAEQWCEERRNAVRSGGRPYAAKTLTREQSATKHYLTPPPIGPLVLATVDVPAIKRTVQQWRAGPRKDRKRDGKTSESTIAHVFAILDNILEAARQDGKLRHNPCRDLRKSERPTKPQPIIRALNATAALAMIDALRATEVGAITEFAAYSGVRLGEALGMPWSNVDLDRREIYVEQVVEQCMGTDDKPYPRLRPYPKTQGSAGDVPLPPQGVAIVKRLKAEYNAKLLAAGMTASPDHLVFPNPNLSLTRRGLPWDPTMPWLPDEFSSWFYLRVGQTGLARISFKALCRATYGTLMACEGVPVHVVQRLLRHSSQSTTMRHYIATLDESKAQAVAAFGEGLDRARRAAGAKS